MVLVTVDTGSLIIITLALTASGILTGVANRIAGDIYDIRLKKHSRKIINGFRKR